MTPERRRLGRLLATAALAAGLGGPPSPSIGADETTVSYAVTIRSTPKYGPDFQHVDYADPDAPKGGSVRLAAQGTFDSLNPFILKGSAAAGIGRIFDTLTKSSADEPSTEYGLVARSIEIPADGSWVAFHLRREARFHDGTPVTPDDVIFSFDVLKREGHPFYRAYYASVIRAERFADWGVKFTFKDGTNQELPAILGQLPVLSKAYYQSHDFAKTTLEPPLGSGPYEVASVDPGRSIVYRRVADYWGARLPINVGQDNFDEIRYDYYRDSTVMLEAFKAGEFDFRLENNAKLWATGYDGPALEKGLIVKALIPHERPAGMQGFAFNIRHPLFADRRVREALGYAFDFEWTNEHLFYRQYKRSYSYFTNSELAATGRPGPEELAVLEPYRDRLPPEVFESVYIPPVTGPRGIRGNLRKAIALLKAAGWSVKNEKLTNERTGERFRFEMLLSQPTFERVVLPFKKNLERLGIDMSVRTVDPAQYQKRLDDFDFDMVVQTFPQSLSPGNEQRDFWDSESARTPGSRNIIGIADPVIDHLVELVIAAPDRQSLIYRCRALDRVLRWGYYVIPNWYLDEFRVAYWNKFGRPEITPRYDLGFSTWWVDPQKARVVDAAQKGRS